MDLLEIILGQPTPRVVGVIGSGGKTSLLTLLVRELTAHGSRVLVTTTTQVYPFPDLPMVDDPARLPAAFQEHAAVFLGRALEEDGKLTGPESLDLGDLRGQADRVLVEGDGARRRPLKVHRPHDPVLPPQVDLAIMVLGASALGERASEETVHRLHKAPTHWNLRPGATLDAATVARMATDAEGYRGKAGGAAMRILVNQADANPDGALQLCEALGRVWSGPILRGSVQRGEVELAEAGSSRPSVILLAAGASERWPGDKLHARLGGRSLLEWSLAPWRNLPVDERILVHRKGDEASRKAAREAGFRAVVCEEPEDGMSASIRAGFAALGRGAGGVLLTLGDMPAIRMSTLKRLLSAVGERPDRVLRPRQGDRPGHPVHLPRSRFEEIAGLTGDRGPRDVLESWDPIYLDVDDEGVILDLDKPAEAARLECLLMEVREDDEAR